MKRKVFLIIGGVLLLCLVAGICLYTIPYKTTTLDATLQATKLDENGNVIGTEEIVVQGKLMNYCFREDCVDLNIAPFGTLNYIKFFNDKENTSIPLRTIFDEFYSLSFVAGDSTLIDDVWWYGSILTSLDFEYWYFRLTDDDRKVHYVASFSGEHTVAEIVQYFKGLAPGYVSDTNTTINN